MSEHVETTATTETVAQAAPVADKEVSAPVAEETTVEATAPAPEPVATVAEPAPVETKFIDSLTEDLRGQKALMDFKDVDGLAKSYLHLNSMIGKKMTDLDPAELGEVYNKLGRPESAEGYTLPDGIDDGVKGWYQESAHKLGLSQDQSRKLAESYMELETAKASEYEANVAAQQEQWLGELKTEFGKSFDQRVEVAKKAVVSFGGEELQEAMNSTGLGSHPAMVKAFAEIGKEMLEGRMTATESSATFGLTPADARNKISNLKRDPEFMKAYMSAGHPAHQASVDELQSLHAALRG